MLQSPPAQPWARACHLLDWVEGPAWRGGGPTDGDKPRLGSSRDQPSRGGLSTGPGTGAHWTGLSWASCAGGGCPAIKLGWGVSQPNHKDQESGMTLRTELPDQEKQALEGEQSACFPLGSEAGERSEAPASPGLACPRAKSARSTAKLKGGGGGAVSPQAIVWTSRSNSA